jgi:hypothetical protein
MEPKYGMRTNEKDALLVYLQNLYSLGKLSNLRPYGKKKEMERICSPVVCSLYCIVL